jgi:hypothetical protein
MTSLRRKVLLVLGGISGFCLGGAVWVFAGAWCVRRLDEQYPPAGPVDMPSPEAIGTIIITLLGTPLAAVVGAVLAVVLIGRYARIDVTERQR